MTGKPTPGEWRYVAGTCGVYRTSDDVTIVDYGGLQFPDNDGPLIAAAGTSAHQLYESGYDGLEAVKALPELMGVCKQLLCVATEAGAWHPERFEADRDKAISPPPAPSSPASPRRETPMTQRDDCQTVAELMDGWLAEAPLSKGRARIIVQRTSAQMAAHVGGPVATEHLTFDVDAPELAAEFAKNWDAYGTRSIVGVELLPDEPLAARSPAPEGGETDPRNELVVPAFNGDEWPAVKVTVTYWNGEEDQWSGDELESLKPEAPPPDPRDELLLQCRDALQAAQRFIGTEYEMFADDGELLAHEARPTYEQVTATLMKLQEAVGDE